MKNFRKIMAFAAAFLMLVSLCACGGNGTAQNKENTAGNAASAEKADTAETDMTVYAREYRFLCGLFGAAYMDSILDYEGEAQDIADQYVEYRAMQGSTITLEADGTGYLYWGEENQGKIDTWSVNGNILTFKAGVSEFTGSIEDGIMKVVIEEGMTLCFVSSDADPAGIRPMTPENYFRLLYGLESESGENG